LNAFIAYVFFVSVSYCLKPPKKQSQKARL